MKEHFFDSEDLTIDKARARLLSDVNLIGHEEEYYQQPLTESEIILRKEQLVQYAVQVASLEQEKKKAMTEFKSKIDPAKSQHSKVLREIKDGAIEVVGEVYYIGDPEAKMVGTYDETGRLLNTRPMTPAERRKNLRFDFGNTGTEF